jgi:diguanylate cyclase (GGDEF)-like protein/PAS domain S-box-containing protein
MGHDIGFASRTAAQTTIGEIGASRVPLDAVPLPAFVYVVRTLRILAANSAAAQVFGYSLDELRAMSLRDLVPDDQLALMRASLAATQNVPDFSGPVRYLTKRGRAVEVEAAVADTFFAHQSARLAILRVKQLPSLPPVAAMRTPNDDQPQAPLLVWTTDSELRLATSLSGGALGFAPRTSRTIGTPVAQLFRNVQGADQALLAHRTALSGTPAEYEIQSGARAYRCFVDALRDTQHDIVGVIGLAFEISENVNLRRALTTAKSSLRVAEETARMGTFEFDLASRTLIWSETLHKLLDVPAAGNLTGEAFFSRVHPDDRAMVRRAFREVRKRRVPFRIEHRIVLENGTQRWLESSAEPVVDERGEVTRLYGATTDITARKNIEDQLAFLAHHDPLTGLPNRTLLVQRLTNAIEQARGDERAVSVVYLNLDNFKRIHDIYGAGEADRVIRICAQRLQECVGPAETVARVSGDEFVVVLTGMEETSSAVHRVECMRAALAEPLAVGTIEIRLSASFGISCYPGDAESAEQLIGFADMAMFRAKKTRRGEFAYFETGLHRAATERLHLEHELRDAIRERQLAVHYQPIVDARTKRAGGVEALVRWKHPTEGMQSPARFIPLAEETGLIVPLGEFVLREALRCVAELHHDGFSDLRLAVNLSTRQLNEKGLPAMVRDALAEAGFPAHLLDLEVTESFLVTDPKHAASVLEELAAFGIRIALDDFGTGYSALSSLRQFPVHQLKLDRSFVTEIEQNATTRAIAGTIIDLAHTLDMSSLAEGVETREQYAALDELGCESFQGYYFARPMAVGALTAYLRVGRAGPAS